MKVTFRKYCGLSGDLHEMSIARSESGAEERCLISRTGFLRYHKMKRAKKRLIKKLELSTGHKHTEI